MITVDGRWRVVGETRRATGSATVIIHVDDGIDVVGGWELYITRKRETAIQRMQFLGRNNQDDIN